MTLAQFLTDTFDRIYIINLAARPDRRSEARQAFEQIGLTIDGDRIRFFAAVRPDNKGPFPSIGARGCFMSHLGVLENAVADGLQSILICEDDLDFARAASLPDLSGLRAGGWTLFYGGYDGIPDHIFDGATDGHATVPPQIGLRTTHCIGMYAPVMAECAEYLRTMAQRPSGSPEGGPMHVDGAYSWFRRQNPQHQTVITVPPIGFQRASRSDIADLSWYDKLPVIRYAIFVLRRMKVAVK